MNEKSNFNQFFLLFHYSSPNLRAVMKSEKSDLKTRVNDMKNMKNKLIEKAININKIKFNTRIVAKQSDESIYGKYEMGMYLYFQSKLEEQIEK